jgi:hypothetical protein
MGWVVDMRHYLDEETGDLPDGLPTPAVNMAAEAFEGVCTDLPPQKKK